ncbi:hypothetical protein BC940DRAFT_276929 [Gongronella butleri]|nr:hypothetical protein BC940DRAFT_276929 [Gongronella butleri]
MSILITSADQFIGYAVTSHLARYARVRPHLRVLCQDEKPCGHLRTHGVDVRVSDYAHPHHLSLAMRNLAHLVLVVGDHPNRVDHARRILRVAARSGVPSIILVSHVGALCGSFNSSLRDYALIEEELCAMDCPWTILRLDWLQQSFHLWAAFIEKQRVFPLPMAPSVEFCPVDIQDVCECIDALVLTTGHGADETVVDQGRRVAMELHDQHNGQVYTLTGPRMVDGKQLVQMMGTATGYPRFRYQMIRPMDLQYYLRFLQKDIHFDARLKKDKTRLHQASPMGADATAYRAIVFGLPSERQIQGILDYFDWIGSTSSSICVPHVHLLTGKPPRSMDAFFNEHANSFKPLV